jgi:hypothetical protein
MRTFVIMAALSLSFSASAEWSRLFVEEAAASSYLKNNWNKYSENYHPNYAFDDNPKTAWVEGADGDGHGSWLRFEVSRVAKAKAVKLKVRNGYQKSKKLFTANAIPKAITVVVRGPGGAVSATKEVTLKKARGWQEIVVDTQGRGVAEVELTLKSTYPGRVYKDTCLSDVQVFVDSDVAYAKAAEEAKRDRLKAWVKGRVDEAKYFAKLPRTYPFAGTHFDLVGEPWHHNSSEYSYQGGDKPVKDPNYTSTRDQLLKDDLEPSVKERLSSLVEPARRLHALAKGKAQLSKKRFRIEGGKEKLILPDNVHFPEAVMPLLERDRFTLAETPKKTRFYQKAKEGQEPIEGYILERSRTTAQVKREDGRVRAIYFSEFLSGVERSTFEHRTHYLVEYDGQERVERVLRLTIGSDQFHMSSTALARGDDGKVDGVKSLHAGWSNEPGYADVEGYNNFSASEYRAPTRLTQR